jgi:hypothetical protein
MSYPNARNNPDGAIPVFLSTSPNAMPIVMSVAVPTDDSGPIPVYFVAPGTPPFGSDQGNPNNAVPVVVSAVYNAMPVWDIGA